MMRNSGIGHGRGENGHDRGGRGDADAGSSMGLVSFPFHNTGVDGNDLVWMHYLQLGEQLGPATTKLCRGEQTLCTANTVVMAGEDRAFVRRIVANAVYDIAYDEYKADCDRFLPKL